MKPYYAHLFLAALVAAYLVGCETVEEKAQSEKRPLELMMWDEWQRRHGDGL